uniref:Putative ovule protein n=1 Tax=Solanum chacoense TaxID=4108 RepID=A0A0V0HFG3_SOLCH
MTRVVIFSFNYCFDLFDQKFFKKQPLYVGDVVVRPTTYTLPPKTTLCEISLNFLLLLSILYLFLKPYIYNISKKDQNSIDNKGKRTIPISNN